MNLDTDTVLVLGAGSTRAFVPDAPLLNDNYDLEDIFSKYQKFPHIKDILDLELSKQPKGMVNIESLMTRLDEPMPYDFEHGIAGQLGFLLQEVKQYFVQRLNNSKTATMFKADLDALARHCVENRINCITFNYDDVLDQALWEVKSVTQLISHRQQDYWHPDGGYGFFCRPGEHTVRDTEVTMDVTSMRLLKLHGSVNWRPKRGYRPPYTIDAIVHHESWLTPLKQLPPDPAIIEMHLEPDPLIVPPVLTKSAVVQQPILRLVWSLAFNALAKAKRILFIGYSLPVTDMAARVLFGEAVQSESKIQVLNKASTDSEKEEFIKRYKEVFPYIKELNFEFEDALEWARRAVPNQKESQLQPPEK